jgi:hypothetical protein
MTPVHGGSGPTREFAGFVRNAAASFESSRRPLNGSLLVLGSAQLMRMLSKPQEFGSVGSPELPPQLASVQKQSAPPGRNSQGEHKANMLQFLPKPEYSSTRDFGGPVGMVGTVAWGSLAKKRPGPLLRLFSTDLTAMVNCGDILPSERVFHLTRGVKRKEKSVSVEDSSVRATISFPPDMYQTLEGIAKEKKVSLAWVVREAADQYIADKWPLFKGKV